MFEKRKEIVYNRTYEITYKGVLVEMSLLEQWRATAYSQEMDKTQLQKFWTTYFQIERGIYEQLLSNPDEEVRGTVKGTCREISGRSIYYGRILRWNSRNRRK